MKTVMDMDDFKFGAVVSIIIIVASVVAGMRFEDFYSLTAYLLQLFGAYAVGSFFAAAIRRDA